MRFSQYVVCFAVSVSVVGGAVAQDAQQIISMAARLYADAPSYTGEVDSRLIQLVYTPVGGGKFSAPEVSGTQYRRLQLKVKRPYGYWLSAQIFMDGAISNNSVSSSVIARSDEKLPKQGLGSGAAFVVRDMPAEQFNAAANSRLGDRAAEDVVLRYFQANSTAPDGEHPLGVVEPDLIGSESLNGTKVYRIMAKTTQNEPITLWIDKDSLLVVRSILQRAYPNASKAVGLTTAGLVASTPTADEVRKIVVFETLYRKQQLAPTLTSQDFSVTQGPGSERPVAEAMGFIPVLEMIKLAEIKPISP